MVGPVRFEFVDKEHATPDLTRPAGYEPAALPSFA